MVNLTTIHALDSLKVTQGIGNLFEPGDTLKRAGASPAQTFHHDFQQWHQQGVERAQKMLAGGGL